MIEETLELIIGAARQPAMTGWGLREQKVYIGEDKAEKAGPQTKYAAIVWESIEEDPYPGFIEHVIRPLYVIYIGPAPVDKRGEMAKAALRDAYETQFVPPPNIDMELVGCRFDEDWGEAKGATVSLVLEFSVLWHECRRRFHKMSGVGLAISGSSAE